MALAISKGSAEFKEARSIQLACSVHEYLKMLVESDMADGEKPKKVDQNEKLKRETDERLARIVEVLESLPARLAEYYCAFRYST